ncbi:unnamed protein product [Mycena citricolor]|uniref:Uncharacterized protein n=1 Tax=Mycena citricolor TaxID=2018698 RepID=A0AAD2K1L5_9AGAR|nr:unnamed protein product [Mycena citricolor]
MPAARSADDDEPSNTSLPSNVNDPVVNALDSVEAPDNEPSSTSLKSGGDDSDVDATGSVESESESELELPASAENPDRQLCKSNSRRGPNGHVWAHSRQDIFSLSRRLWSISMIEVADREYPSEKPFSSTVHRHGRETPLEPEPEPRKMRMWPVLTVDGDMESVPDDLRDIRDPTVPKEIPESSWNRTPKLTQRIPPEMLPEILRVKDRKDRLGSGAENSKAGRLKYQRVYPRPDQSIDPDAPRTQASLEFPAECDVIGTGHHATVFRADITFEAPFRLVGSSGPPKVRLTAKITNDAKDDRDMLEHEARLYPRFPDHLSEDWSGFIGVDSMAGEVWDYGPILPPCAVVPKFYGYYIPVPSEDADNTQVGRPFLLLEDCGKRIAPFHFDNDERRVFRCQSRLLRPADGQPIPQEHLYIVRTPALRRARFHPRLLL